MAPKFGTSGLRGLVTDLTDDLVSSYVSAFLATCSTGGAVHVGWDLRASSPDIAEAVIAAVQAAGQRAVVHGVLPTPALALAAQTADAGAVMITGSHIPADRNGLKFYTTAGEILKADEQRILAHLGTPAAAADPGPRDDAAGQAAAAYVARYVTAFGPAALQGLTIGVYQHSSVARDIAVDVVTGLGAQAVPLARSDTFIAVDTEAIDPDTRQMLADWCATHGLDAIISTDGDADRPMVADANGQIVPGDVLGVLSAQMLGADTICTPVSSNSMVTQLFQDVTLTRIGSPYVIAAMEEVQTSTARCVGYEANGGFLLGFEAQGPAGTLAPLMTRDCLLPIVAPLTAARAAGQTLADSVAALPPRFTAADRLTGIASDTSAALIAQLTNDNRARAAFFAATGTLAGIDTTDGLRVQFDEGTIVHLRPSGNAPELRCYAEAAQAHVATDLVATYLTRCQQTLATPL